ncbi:MAG: iron-sulfur cluster assembly scaffold protein [Pseudomonadota bacterium]
MINDVYNRKLLSLAGNIAPNGRLPAPDASATAHSKLCGSHISIDIRVDRETSTITGYAHEVKACALGQAAAAVVAQQIVGAHFDDARKAREQLSAMLKSDGDVPQGRFEDLKYLQPVKDYPARHASTLLALDALNKALDAIQNVAPDTERA